MFPVKVPSLRERREDIRLLVEYFIDRYATKAGKKITSIEKKSLAHLQSYAWPGNIRELQNVIERSVILCDSDEFSVDESWLTLRPAAVQPLREDLVDQEKKRIEAALAEAGGRVSGSSGARRNLACPPPRSIPKSNHCTSISAAFKPTKIRLLPSRSFGNS